MSSKTISKKSVKWVVQGLLFPPNYALIQCHKKEPNLTTSRLALLIDSLASGADVFNTDEMEVVLDAEASTSKLWTYATLLLMYVCTCCNLLVSWRSWAMRYRWPKRLFVASTQLPQTLLFFHPSSITSSSFTLTRTSYGTAADCAVMIFRYRWKAATGILNTSNLCHLIQHDAWIVSTECLSTRTFLKYEKTRDRI